MRLDNFTAAVEALPALPAGRRAALAALAHYGLPTTADEDWKYTDLSVLSRLSVAEIAPDARNHDYPEAYDCGLDALNAALAGGRQTHTIDGHAEFNTGLHRRLRLQVRGDAEIVLDDAAAAPFATFFAAIELAPNSRLRLTRIQGAADTAQRLTRLRVALARDAQLDAVTVDFGGGFVRHDLEIALQEPGAQARLHGLYLARGAAHVDNHTRIDHRAPRCLSREFFRGLAFDRARAVFNGKIVVHPGAQQTDSEQRVANLLLSKTAEINAKPELEIYADDVKCAHGATFGQLDENAIFYLRTRGIDRESARALLICAFAEQVLRKIEHAQLRRRVTQAVLARLPQMSAPSPSTGPGESVSP